MVLEELDIHIQKSEQISTALLLTTFKKIILYIVDLNVNPETIKPLEESEKKNLCNLGTGKV